MPTGAYDAEWYATIGYETIPLDGWVSVDDNRIKGIRDDIERRFKWSSSGKRAYWGDIAWNERFGALLNTRRIDPIRVWLDALPAWDKEERLDRILIDALDCPDTDLNREVGSRLLVGAVARTYRPGCMHDWIPVIVGAQGSGKSTFVSNLVPIEHIHSWFVENVHFAMTPKEMVEAATGAAIVEFGEMKGIHRAELEALKQFITRRSETVRLSYRRNPDDILRRWVGCGTVNTDPDGVLPQDTSGHRRFRRHCRDSHTL